MHWLDAQPSREIDPVLDCLTYLARESDRPSSPVLLRAGLAVSEKGTLPFHQIEPALEQVGMRGDPVSRKLRGWPSRKLPAILELSDERARFRASPVNPADLEETSLPLPTMANPPAAPAADPAAAPAGQ